MEVLSAKSRVLLRALLEEAKGLGFLGPGPVEGHVERSLAFCVPVGSPAHGINVDLGTGGGVPGLVLALAWPGTRWLFVESNLRRAAWLTEAVRRTGLGTRVEILNERAEVVGRGPYRHQAQLVTARAFAPPGATAECAAPLLVPGGHLIVADPPEGTISTEERWPELGLATLGLRSRQRAVLVTSVGPVNLTVLQSYETCPERFPRRVGAPTKRPLF